MLLTNPNPFCPIEEPYLRNEIDVFYLKQNTEWHKDEENGRDSVSPTYDADSLAGRKSE